MKRSRTSSPDIRCSPFVAKLVDLVAALETLTVLRCSLSDSGVGADQRDDLLRIGPVGVDVVRVDVA